MPKSEFVAVPSPLEHHLGFWLRFVSNHVSRRFENLLAEQGISTSEWVAVRTLHDRSDSTHASLIRKLAMTKGAVSKVVTKLEDKGFVVRSFAGESARDQVLSLTAPGRRLVIRLAKLADENDQFFFGHLDSGKRNELMTLMQELVKHHQFSELPVE